MSVPESRAYRDSQESIERWNRRILLRTIVALGVALAISVSGNVYGVITHAEDHAAIGQLVQTITSIRNTQVANHHVTVCQTETFDAILKDAKLAFNGDKNPADYAKTPAKC